VSDHGVAQGDTGDRVKWRSLVLDEGWRLYSGKIVGRINEYFLVNEGILKLYEDSISRLTF